MESVSGATKKEIRWLACRLRYGRVLFIVPRIT